jgi:hypothetical protein
MQIKKLSRSDIVSIVIAKGYSGGTLYFPTGQPWRAGQRRASLCDRARAKVASQDATDVGPGWLQLGACNVRSSRGVSNAFTVQKIALTAIVNQAHNSN